MAATICSHYPSGSNLICTSVSVAQQLCLACAVGCLQPVVGLLSKQRAVATQSVHPCLGGTGQGELAGCSPMGPMLWLHAAAHRQQTSWAHNGSGVPALQALGTAAADWQRLTGSG